MVMSMQVHGICTKEKAHTCKQIIEEIKTRKKIIEL